MLLRTFAQSRCFVASLTYCIFAHCFTTRRRLFEYAQIALRQKCTTRRCICEEHIIYLNIRSDLSNFWSCRYWNAFGHGLEAASSPSFVDYRQFAGFSDPSVKQYALNIDACGLLSDLCVYPKPQSKVVSAEMRPLANITVGFIGI